jgi:hypothetical protein
VRRHEDEAEQMVHHLPRTIAHNLHMELVRSLELLLGDLKEERIPAPTMVEGLLEQFEDNELRAEPLDYVTARREWEQNGPNPFPSLQTAASA